MPKAYKFPLHGWFGIGLVSVFWIINWSFSGTRSAWAFFPLWVGYCLMVDGLVFVHKGSSIITRSRKAFIILFMVSAPVWWLFELLNTRTENWHYYGREYFSDLQYFLIATFCFSTVIPAVFGTAELVSTFKWVKNTPSLRAGRQFAPSSMQTGLLFICGWILLVLLLLWPLYFFPFVWISLILILEPLNIRMKNRSLLEFTAQGDWRPIISLCLGCLICGFFWEMWNFYAFPKWQYTIPFVDFWRIFEMPILGYGGYIPFSWELYALYHFITGFFPSQRNLFSRNWYIST